MKSSCQLHRAWQILTHRINESAKVCLNAAYCKTLWTGCIFNPHTKGPGLCDKTCQRMGRVSASQVWHLLTIQDFWILLATPLRSYWRFEDYVFPDKFWEPGETGSVLSVAVSGPRQVACCGDRNETPTCLFICCLTVLDVHATCYTCQWRGVWLVAKMSTCSQFLRSVHFL